MDGEWYGKQKALVGMFKQFVEQALYKHFKSSHDTVTEWNYFSSLLSQDRVDYDKVKVYLDVMLSGGGGQAQSSPSKIQYNTLKLPTKDQQKTNSGIYGKKQGQGGQTDRTEFQLNRTVGGNTDRIKFTGMFPVKPTNFYSFESKDKKKQVPKLEDNGVGALIQGMEEIINSMVDNHSRMQSKTDQMVVANTGIGGGSNNYYSYRNNLRE